MAGGMKMYDYERDIVKPFINEDAVIDWTKFVGYVKKRW
jgi:hypothetical protein